jgi:hypothetical protein
MGKIRFIIVTGALNWGLHSGALWLLLMHLIDPKFDIRGHLATAALVWPIGGCCWGWYVWHDAENKYLNYISTKK